MDEAEARWFFGHETEWVDMVERELRRRELTQQTAGRKFGSEFAGDSIGMIEGGTVIPAGNRHGRALVAYGEPGSKPGDEELAERWVSRESSMEALTAEYRTPKSMGGTAGSAGLLGDWRVGSAGTRGGGAAVATWEPTWGTTCEGRRAEGLAWSCAPVRRETRCATSGAHVGVLAGNGIATLVLTVVYIKPNPRGTELGFLGELRKGANGVRGETDDAGRTREWCKKSSGCMTDHWRGARLV